MQNFNRNIRIMVHDDQDIYREGIVHILKAERDFEVVAVLDKNGVVEAVEYNQPDVIITPVQAEKPDVAATTRAIALKYPHISVLAVCLLHQEHSVIQMLTAGAKGCLLRNARREDVIQAIRAVYRSEHYFSQHLTHRLYHLVAKADVEKFNLRAQHVLSEKDKTFIRLLCKGYSMKQIAGMINLTIGSVEHKKKVLYERLDKQNLAGLFNYAIVNGIYDPYEFGQ